MDNPIIQTIKFIILLLVTAIGLGTLGALALSRGVIIAGAVCFLIAGILIGILVGLLISGIGEEE